MRAPANLRQAIDQVALSLEQSQVALGQGTLNALDEAAWLVLSALGLPLDSDDAQLLTPISAEQWQRVQSWLTQRIEKRIPMAYLTGEAWLQGVPFHVDARTIIPRSLIAEVLADGMLDAYIPESDAQVLDLCTGNGSLAILCAMAWPWAHIDAIDLSTDALAVAHQNLQRHGMTESIRLLEGDGLTPAQGPYHLVVCNPPYVNRDSMNRLPPEFRHEPAMALAGGDDGMDFIRPLLKHLPDRLTPHGALVLEIGHEIEHFMRAFPSLNGLWLPTSAGDEQVVLLTRQDLLSLTA
jgi:ribosomal protein L3 glutamine methyltransferase